jgi:hypothetical protein
MMGAVEGGVMGVIVKNIFTGAIDPVWLNFSVAVLAGAKAFANITSLLWTALSHGRNKIHFLVGLQVASVVLVAMVALAPKNAAGLLMMMIGVVGARICWAGVVTLRSTVWRVNYRRESRARVAGKLATIQSIVLTLVGLLIGAAMTINDDSFRLLYPLAALCGLFGAAVYRRVRLRGHRALVLAERTMSLDERPSLNPLAVGRVLRNDKQFDRFMACQYVFGVGNLMVGTPLVIILKDRFDFGYIASIAIVATIPFLFVPLSIPFWARLFDKVHIIRFRAIHSWTFVASTSLILVATVASQSWLLWISAAVQGIAFGGGVLAWNLGHHDFTSRQQASHYMGVHVTLTGVRGLIGPTIAWCLYELLQMHSPGSGSWVFAAALALTTTGAIGFVVLDRASSRIRPDAGPKPALPADSESLDPGHIGASAGGGVSPRRLYSPIPHRQPQGGVRNDEHFRR